MQLSTRIVNPFFDFAAKYFESNYSVFPTTNKDSKVPAISGWTYYCKNMPTEDQIKKWEVDSLKKSWNITLACGEASNIVVFDWDCEDEVLSRMVKRLLPHSPIAKIGNPKRWSIFYKYTSEFSKYTSSTHKMANGASYWELLSNGKHSVLPPSSHPISGQYIWAAGNALCDMEAKDLPIITREELSKVDHLIDSYSEDPQTSEGRHNFLIKMLFRSIEKAKSKEQLKQELIKIDDEMFGENSYLKDDNERKGKSIDQFCDYLIESAIRTVVDKKKERGISWQFGQDTDDQLAGARRFFIEKINEKTGQVIYIPNQHALANYFAKEGLISTSASRDFVFNGTHWEITNRELIERKVFDLTKPIANAYQVKEFKKMAIVACHGLVDSLEPSDGKLNFRNGVLDLRTREFTKDQKQYFFRYTLSYDYDPSAKCPEFMKFLDEIFCDETSPLITQAQIRNIQKAFGYTILGGNPYLHKAFFLVGSGRNGKSTLMQVFSEVIGKNNTSSVTIAGLSRPFSVVTLDGKMLNYVEEFPRTRQVAEAFKTAASGGELVCSHKGKDEFSIKIKTRFFFSANELPHFFEMTPGLMSRFVVFNFNNSFFGSKQKLDIASSLIKEAPGILNWVLEGLDLFLSDPRFEETPEAAESIDEMKMNVSNVYDWWSQCIELQPKEKGGGEYTTTQLYEEYQKFCVQSGIIPIHRKTMREFSTELKAIYKSKADEAGLEINKTVTIRFNSGATLKGYKSIILKRIVLEDSFRPGF